MVNRTMTKFPCKVVDVEFIQKVVNYAAIFSPSARDGGKLSAKGLGLFIVTGMFDRVEELLTEFTGQKWPSSVTQENVVEFDT